MARRSALLGALGALALLASPLPALSPQAQAQANPQTEAEALALDLFVRNRDLQKKVLLKIRDRGSLDMVPALIQALRFFGPNSPEIGHVLDNLTGESLGNDWHAWMRWQQLHPEVEPFEGFDGFKADLMARIDPNFRIFLSRGVAHEIRLEEITWGGVPKDGIPALTNPTHVAPSEADYITEQELVFGIEINGDARAYPLRIMDWHEMFNDVIGGVPVALAYCTLCASGILFETQREPGAAPIIFGSSGFLYRSNKLMYDQETHSLWNQFTGRPVVGPLTGSGVELKVRPVAITTWGKWLKRHPDTKVLSLDTGFRRDYAPGQPYGDYFASDRLMFPVAVADASHKPKDYVFALRAGDHEKAWPLSAFESEPVLNDRVGALDVVLIGQPESRTVRAYRAGGQDFAAAGEDGLSGGGKSWRIEEDALVAEDGERLERLPGHIAFWFAWSGYKPEAPVYTQ